MPISVIIPSWNGDQYLDGCLGAVLAQADVNVEVIVVDNGSTDRSVEILSSYQPRITLVENGANLGFAASCSIGLRLATGAIAVLLNQDTIVQPGWLEALEDAFDESEAIGIVGCKILYPDGRTLQHAGALIARPSGDSQHIGHGEQDTGQYNMRQEVDYVTGAAFAIRRNVLVRLGGLDDGYLPAFFEETDYCFRARRAGFKVVYQPTAVVYHFESTSWEGYPYPQRQAFHRNRVRFLLRHWSSYEFGEFAECEQAKLDALADVRELRVLTRAYFDNLLDLAARVAERRADPTLGGDLSTMEWRKVAGSLQRLYRHALECTQTQLLQSQFFDAPGKWSNSATEQLIRQVNAPPISTVPILGKLVTRLRAFLLNTFVWPAFFPILEHQARHIGVLHSRVDLLTDELSTVVRQIAGFIDPGRDFLETSVVRRSETDEP